MALNTLIRADFGTTCVNYFVQRLQRLDPADGFGALRQTTDNLLENKGDGEVAQSVRASES